MSPSSIRITDEIYQVGGGSLSAPEDAAIYLINFSGSVALVDAGCGKAEDRVLENVRSLGVSLDQISHLLITHCHFDHTGGAKALRDRLGCELVAHELDAVFLETGDDRVTAASWYGSSLEPVRVDRKLANPQEYIDLGGRTITAIHTPGHSPGSVVYLTESQELRVLLAQDVHGPLDSSLLSNRADYLKSLELLMGLDVDILCEGHFGVFRGKASANEFIQSFLRT